MSYQHDNQPVKCPDCGGRRQPHKARCYHCARRHHEDRPTPAAPSSEPYVGPYRCRTHLSPVTWRGTGCLHCLEDLKKPKAKPVPPIEYS